MVNENNNIGDKLKSRKTILLKVVLGFLTILGIGLAVWIVTLTIKPNTDAPTSTTIDYNEIAIGGEATVTELEEYIRQTDNQISEAPDAESKSMIYSNRAGTLSNYLDFPGYDFKNQVLADAKKAEELYPTAYTAFSLSWYEQEFGDESAAQYYRQIANERGFKIEDLGVK